MPNKDTNKKTQDKKQASGTVANSKGNMKAISKINQEEENRSYHLIPIFIVLCIIPLFVRAYIYKTNMSQYAWYSGEDSYTDFFLYYKQVILLVVAGVMAIAAVIKLLIEKRKLQLSPILIPLASFAVLAVLSAIFSDYMKASFLYSFELFESVFVLLSYCIIIFYTYLYLKTEKDFKLIIYYIIALAIILSILGIFQYFGHDLFGTDLGSKLIVPEELRQYVGVSLTNTPGTVYLTFYNPNYIGVYVALVAPIIAVFLLFQKKILPIVISILAIIGLLICEYGSKSLAGYISLGVAFICILLFMWRYLIKYIYITIPAVILLVIFMVLLDFNTNHYLTNKLKSALQTTTTVSALTDLHTEEDGVELTYGGNQMKVQCIVDSNQSLSLVAFDQNNQVINLSYDGLNMVYSVNDVKFPNTTLGFDKQNAGTFYINIEGQQWRFTNLTDGTYYFINYYNRPDKIIPAKSAVFTGHESFASGRGYIWSRTIPLLKKYIILGSGPNTFTMAFPQQDYFNLVKYGYGGQIITKPHNMYLQMAVQTGVLSLIAFLIFYGMYFVSSLRLYFRGRFNSFYSKIGVAIFIGTISYMVTGLTNDSNINTSPIFWTLLGVGIAVNRKAKPLILEEIAQIKAKKSESVNA